MKYPVTTTAEREIGHHNKEKLFYISFNYDTELKSTAEISDKFHTYELSDRNIIFPKRRMLYANVVFPSGTTWWQLRHQTCVSFDVRYEGLGTEVLRYTIVVNGQNYSGSTRPVCFESERNLLSFRWSWSPHLI